MSKDYGRLPLTDIFEEPIEQPKVELKTLKDLRARKTHTDDECVSKDFLRKEAIKWIKELETEGNQDCAEGCCQKYTGFGHPAVSQSLFEEWQNPTKNVIDWIKHFFNITIEDLREV